MLDDANSVRNIGRAPIMAAADSVGNGFLPTTQMLSLSAAADLLESGHQPEATFGQ